MDPENRKMPIGASGDKRRQRLAAALRSNLVLRKARSKAVNSNSTPKAEVQTEPLELIEEADTLQD